MGALVYRTGDNAILEGDLTLMVDGACKLSYLDSKSQLISGDEVLTSGKGGVYPSGLVVGYVSDVKTTPSGTERYAVVKPAIALDQSGRGIRHQGLRHHRLTCASTKRCSAAIATRKSTRIFIARSPAYKRFASAKAPVIHTHHSKIVSLGQLLSENPPGFSSRGVARTSVLPRVRPQ